MFKTLAAISFSAIALYSSVAIGQVTPMDWTSTNDGSIGAVTVSVTGVSSPDLEVLTGVDLQLPNFDPPLLNADVLRYRVSNDWTASFSSPVSNFLVYVRSWRGQLVWPGFDDPPVGYSFDRPFSILSGLDGASISGNTLILDDDFDDFYDGILRFQGAFDSLSVSVSSNTNLNGVNGEQFMTFAVLVPEPGTLALLATLLPFLHHIRRRR